jgi:hypothetical protein
MSNLDEYLLDSTQNDAKPVNYSKNIIDLTLSHNQTTDEIVA